METKTIWEMLWESVKLPLRALVFGLFSFALSQAVLFIASRFNVVITIEMQAQITTWFTGIVTTAFTVADNWVHQIAKQKAELANTTPAVKGILPF